MHAHKHRTSETHHVQFTGSHFLPSAAPKHSTPANPGAFPATPPFTHHTEVQQVTELFVCPNCSHSLLLLLIHTPTDSTVAVLEQARGRGRRYFNDYSKLPTPLMNILKRRSKRERGEQRKTLCAAPAASRSPRTAPRGRNKRSIEQTHSYVSFFAANSTSSGPILFLACGE